MKQQGFSLIELVTVLLIITVLTTVALRSTVDIGYSARYEQTRDRLDSIKQAIIGNPKRSINGQPDISGFVADMGRLPDNIRELIQRHGDCDNDTYDYSQTECTNNGGTWDPNAWNDNAVSQIDPDSNLKYGWNGPYLSVSDNPANSDAYTDGWGREIENFCSTSLTTDPNSCPDNTQADWIIPPNDFKNYGWYFYQIAADNLTILSFGKDHDSGGSDYDSDYPATQPVIRKDDWIINIGSSGINITFIKPYTATIISTPPTSLCTDPTKTTKSACLSPNSWYGGCDKAGYLNKDSCVAALGNWIPCSDGTSTDKTSCETAGKYWYGEGYACSNQQATDKASCLALPATWRSCTDDGTITDQITCLNSNQIWYGNSLYILDFPPQSNSYTVQPICLKVFYRQSGSVNTAISSNPPLNSREDGSQQTFYFTFTNPTDIPAGINAIGIYEHNGTTCTDTLYPSDRTQPIPVLFVPHRTLPIINW